MKTEPTQKGNYSSQPHNSSCSFPLLYFMSELFFFSFFFALIALAGLKETLEEQSCYGNRASWAEQEPEDLALVPLRVLIRKARV